MSKNNDTNKSNLLETVMYAVALGTVIVTQMMSTTNTDNRSDRTNEIKENMIHIYTTPIVDPKSAKDYAKVSAKVQEAEKEADDYWRSSIARDIAEFARDKDDCVKVHAINELTKIANNTKDWYWRRRIMEQIDEI